MLQGLVGAPPSGYEEGSAVRAWTRRLLVCHAARAHDIAIADAILNSVAAKWEGHEINTARFIQPERMMHSIGG